jgi:ACS family allantoate permease-like MFS transporter
MMVSLPWTSKGGLLAAVYLGGLGMCFATSCVDTNVVLTLHVGTPGFVLSLSWCASTNLGHTKKTTW